MGSILKISNAATLAIHTTVLMAEDASHPFTVSSVASHLKVSEAHLSKVMQRLSRADLVDATRGPKGGYRLRSDASEITLLHVYEAIEGPLTDTKCLLGSPVCSGNKCVLGDLTEMINWRVRQYLTQTRLSDLKGVFGGMAALWGEKTESRKMRIT
jgi:Rrf2 family transcriptional regulator, nitric oxide-sensitive transcriptional repressor